MSGRRIARAAAVAALVAHTSCVDYRLTDPRPPVDEATAFFVFLSVDHDDSARYEVRASFFRDAAASRAGAVRDEAIVVDGTRVEREAPRPGVPATYEWRETRPASEPRTGALVVRGPELADGRAAVVSLPLVGRDGAGLAAPAPGEDLRLRVLTTPPPPGLESRGAQWSLDVRTRCWVAEGVSYVTIFGTSAVPADLRVPRGLLPDPLPDPLAACLQVSQGFVVPEAPYLASAGVSARLEWRVAP